MSQNQPLLPVLLPLDTKEKFLPGALCYGLGKICSLRKKNPTNNNKKQQKMAKISHDQQKNSNKSIVQRCSPRLGLARTNYSITKGKRPEYTQADQRKFDHCMKIFLCARNGWGGGGRGALAFKNEIQETSVQTCTDYVNTHQPRWRG